MTEANEPRPTRIPEDYEDRAERCHLAFGFEGGASEEVDIDGRYLLVNNQVALVDMLDEEDAEGIPSVWALEFESMEAREAHLLERHFRLLMRWRYRQFIFDEAPEAGRVYPVRFRDSFARVLEVELDDAGEWSRVKVGAGTTISGAPVIFDGSGAEWLSREQFLERLEER